MIKSDQIVRMPSVSVAKIENRTLAIGYDREKVARMEEDLTRLCDVDNSLPWDKNIVACRVTKLEPGQSRKLKAGCRLLGIGLID